MPNTVLPRNLTKAYVSWSEHKYQAIKNKTVARVYATKSSIIIITFGSASSQTLQATIKLLHWWISKRASASHNKLVSLAWTLALRSLIISSIQCKTHQIQEVIGIHLLKVWLLKGPQTIWPLPPNPRKRSPFFGFHPSCCSQIQVLNWKLQNSHEHLGWREVEPVGHHLWVNRDPVLVSGEPYITGKHFLSSTLNMWNMLLTGKTLGVSTNSMIWYT